MKKIILFTVLVVLSLGTGAAQERKNKVPVSSSSNAASGVSEGPLGPDETEKEEARERASSMGGAPNVGAGMGTGTGAGSPVGNKVKGTISAGAAEGD